MFSTDDTIVAIATPPGRGGIGIVRLSGPAASRIAEGLAARARPFEPRRATLVNVAGVDHVVVTIFPAPHSYTGDDVAELSAHGSPVVLRALVEASIRAGARLAEPGEFTLRAFLNGRIDLPQAEAVADLVDAVTPLQARAAFDQLQGTLSTTIAALDASLFDLVARLEASVDFPEEGYHFVDPTEVASALDNLIERVGTLLSCGRRGQLVREGLQVSIIGKPNVGKSSLFNALAGAARAIVTPTPGTTRDLVTDVVAIDGLRTTLVDTAGLREAVDPVEAEGVARARGARRVADLVLVVLDVSRPLDENDRLALDEAGGVPHVVVVNKVDMASCWTDADIDAPVAIRVSASQGTGLDELRAAMAIALGAEPRRDAPAITNVRHLTLVEQARNALVRARAAVSAADGSLSEEFVLADLQAARAAFEEISGRRTPDEVLAHIFERFCIGK